jgi:hypothetical protein
MTEEEKHCGNTHTDEVVEELRSIDILGDDEK